MTIAAAVTPSLIDNLPAGQFSQYNKNFQEKIFQGLLSDTTWASQMIEVMRPDFFELKNGKKANLLNVVYSKR